MMSNDQGKPSEQGSRKPKTRFRTAARTALSLSLLTAFTISCVVLFIWPGTWFNTPNTGHRLGGDVFNDLSENTLEAFRKAIAELEGESDYFYSECDLRETSDNRVVVFHDWNLGRLVPDDAANRAVVGNRDFNDVAIEDLTLKQIGDLRLICGCSIPSLEDVLKCAEEIRPTKPLILEIKNLKSDEARYRVIELTRSYRDRSGLEINFSAFTRSFKNSFPQPRSWLDKFAAAGFRVYQVYRPKTASYDFCETW